MTKDEIRLAIIRWTMDQQDDSVLYRTWQQIRDEDRVLASGKERAGRNTLGNQVTRDELAKQLEESIAGPLITISELEQQSENW